MPTYDYKCKTCNKEFEHFQSMSENSLTKCLCGKDGDVAKMISSGSGIIFKGSGFYVTDYKKNDQTMSKNEPSVKTESAPSCGSGGCCLN